LQRDEETSLPKLFYSKVPDLRDKVVIVLDPMLATGGSAKVAIDVCVSFGADINKLIFANVVASPQGIALLHQHFPALTIVTGRVDEGLNAKVYSAHFSWRRMSC
jgi:uracil phosphoribosyltransferase